MQPGLSTVDVIGTVGDSATGAAATSVTVNGVAAVVSSDGSFRATVAVHAGANLIETKATSADGGQADDVRGVLTGTFRPAGTMVDNAIAAQLSAAAFTTLGNTAAQLAATTDLGAFVMPLNPVVAKGLSNGQEDCLYGKVSVRPGLDVQTADVAIVPGDAGLALDVTLHGLYIPLHARYAAACIDADTDITIRATTARIRGTVAVTASGGRFAVTLVSPTVTFTGFDLSASGVPGAVLSLLDLNHEIGKVLATSMEKFIGPMVEQTIAGVHIGPQTVSVLNQAVTVEVAAAGVGFDSAGAEMVLDSKITVGAGSHGFLFSDDQAPPMRGSAGFQLAVADDTINQLLTGFWDAHGLDLTMPQALGNYDAVHLQAMMPPTVSAGADGAMRIVMPDLIVHMTNQGDEITTVAMSLEMALKVAPKAGAPNFATITIETPTLHADVLSDLTGIPTAGLEALTPLLIRNTMETFAPLLAAVPLPPVAGGIRVSSLRLGTDTSYLVVNGNLE
jgi:Glucodextranase, domain B